MTKGRAPGRNASGLFTSRGCATNLRTMAKSKSDSGTVRMVGWNFDIPPAVARRFVEDMRAYHAEKSLAKREEIAARQAWLLNEHLPRGA